MQLHRAAMLLALFVTGASSVDAQERWTFEVEPYVWVPDLTGEGSTDGEPSVDVEVDYPGGLSAALPLAVRVDAPGPSSFRVDVLYARWTDDEGTLESESKLALLDVGYGYALAEWLDVTAGLRGVDLSLELELGGADAEASEQWVDPWLGARGAWPLAEHWSVSAIGDVGGFGVGSELTWQAAAYFGWSSTHWRVDLGYRALYVELDEDDLDTELLAHGPLLGVGFRW